MAQIKKGLAEVAEGRNTLAGVSRGLGRDSSYLQVRSRRSAELRRLMDEALMERSETLLGGDVYLAGDWLVTRVLQLCELAHQGKGEMTAADIDRLARSLGNLIEVIDRTSAAARARDAERSGRGDTATELFAAFAARFGPPPAQIEGTGE